MTLLEFLEARLTEDELVASAATEGTANWHVLYSYRDVKDGDGHYVVLADSRYPTTGQAAHIAWHSPALILRQCEVGRALMPSFCALKLWVTSPAATRWRTPSDSSRQFILVTPSSIRRGSDDLIRQPVDG